MVSQFHFIYFCSFWRKSYHTWRQKKEPFTIFHFPLFNLLHINRMILRCHIVFVALHKITQFGLYFMFIITLIVQYAVCCFGNAIEIHLKQSHAFLKYAKMCWLLCDSRIDFLCVSVSSTSSVLNKIMFEFIAFPCSTLYNLKSMILITFPI